MTDARQQEGERLRDYFDVQLRFAQVLAERTGASLADACLSFTNLHRRFGLGRPDPEAPSPEWTRYAADLERRVTADDRLAWTVAFFIQCPPEPVRNRRFGCFSYEFMAPHQAVRIHFGNRDSDDGAGPLARAKIDRRRSELREMFAYIREHHPDAQTVIGGSWLYNLEAYRRLFPPAYAASTFQPERVRLEGTSSWGQLLDFRGAVKPTVRDEVLANVGVVDAAAPWTAFPLRALGALGEVVSFHQFYGT